MASLNQGVVSQNEQGVMLQKRLNEALRAHNSAQLAAMKGPENTAATRQRLGMSAGDNPTHQQLCDTWFYYGGREKFNETHTLLIQEPVSLLASLQVTQVTTDVTCTT
jgi:hypothetical protein